MGSTRGRSTRRFKAIAAEVRARREPCCLCGQAIDYRLPATDAESFTVAHWHPVATHPDLAEDPGNIRGAAHRSCNAAAGVSNDLPPLGPASTDW